MEYPTQDEPAQANATQLNNNTSIPNSSITYASNPNQSIIEPMGYDEAKETIRDQIDYEIMCDRYPKERIDEIVDIASEALCSNRSTFTLGKDTYPYALVKDRLLRLESQHIEYIRSTEKANKSDSIVANL